VTAGADGRIEAHINRGADLFRKRHFDAALQEFDAAIGLGGRLAGLFYNRARTLQELGRLEEALPAFEAALREQPDYPEALNGLGNVLCDLRRHSEALDAYDRVLQQRPEHLGALINRSNVRRTLGRFEDALLDCDAAVRRWPSSTWPTICAPAILRSFSAAPIYCWWRGISKARWSPSMRRGLPGRMPPKS
jgi:tetratricopeptide (TPR) repeat protein